MASPNISYFKGCIMKQYVHSGEEPASAMSLGKTNQGGNRWLVPTFRISRDASWSNTYIHRNLRVPPQCHAPQETRPYWRIISHHCPLGALGPSWWGWSGLLWQALTRCCWRPWEVIQMHDLNPVRSWSRSGSRLRPWLERGRLGDGFAESWKVFVAVFLFEMSNMLFVP